MGQTFRYGFIEHITLKITLLVSALLLILYVMTTGMLAVVIVSNVMTFYVKQKPRAMEHL